MNLLLVPFLLLLLLLLACAKSSYAIDDNGNGNGNGNDERIGRRRQRERNDNDNIEKDISCNGFFNITQYPSQPFNKLGVIVTLMDAVAAKTWTPFLRNWNTMLTFARKNGYPLLVFHWDDLEIERREWPLMLNDLKENDPPLLIVFHKIHIAAEYPEVESCSRPDGVLMSTWRYMQMNQFLGRDMYNLPVLQQFEYGIRMDSDIILMQPIETDQFMHMKTNNFLYGHNQMMYELPFPKGTCLERVKKYYNEFPQRFTQYHSFYLDAFNYKLDAGCFELWKTSVYNDANFMEFYDGIKAGDGIYHECWREQLFKTLYLRTTIPASQGYLACDFYHAHKLSPIVEPQCRKGVKITTNQRTILTGVLAEARNLLLKKANNILPKGKKLDRKNVTLQAKAKGRKKPTRKLPPKKPIEDDINEIPQIDQLPEPLI